ncbi:hypothetical protein MTO96_043201, partial [Rhipicephalus appendiculatus]
IVHAVDWYPTLLSATGVQSTSEDIDGVDQWPMIRDGAENAPRSEFIYNLDRKENKIYGAIRQGDLKLILRPSKIYSNWYEETEEQPETLEAVETEHISALYNITADPNEREDLFMKMKTDAKRLATKLREQVRHMVPSRHREDVAEGDPSKREPKGTYGPGWCTAPVLNQLEKEPPMLSDDADIADYY